MHGLISIFPILFCTAVSSSNFRGHSQQGSVTHVQLLAPSPQSPGNTSGANEAKAWWNNSADEDFQHIDRGYVTKGAKSWEMFLPRFSWVHKRVLDYGIGAGYLGETLFKRYPIELYVGVDISQKALDAAGKVLEPWGTKVQLLLTPQSFHSLAPDIFVSQQVIQHFPSLEYFTDFLRNVDASGASELMLQFRRAPDGVTKANDAYKVGLTQDVAMGLVTTHEFIAKHLPHYLLRWFDTQPMSYGTLGEFTKWTRRAGAGQ
jgi:SAM-dependent methyltransferase